MTAWEVVQAIGRALHTDIEFDPAATTADTLPVDAFRARSGVCQDISHIMIACLRGIGVPAGYVSGYLQTIPPAGQPRQMGADAMHAWVQAWCGNDIGWVEFDPTNAKFVDTDHIVVARGRDYADVAPNKGVWRTAGKQKREQKVDVIPV
jgi:transglutaminase-like putative cysteine protease